jgi:hypothetical protein
VINARNDSLTLNKENALIPGWIQYFHPKAESFTVRGCLLYPLYSATESQCFTRMGLKLQFNPLSLNKIGRILCGSGYYIHATVGKVFYNSFVVPVFLSNAGYQAYDNSFVISSFHNTLPTFITIFLSISENIF